MLIVETNTTFERYLKSLSKASKKNYKYAQKSNNDLTYTKIPFDRELVERFMKLWEQQVIRGRHRRWKFGVNHVEELEKQNRLMVFAASNKNGFQAVHFVQLHENYIEAHPPMYDKKYGSERYLAKWMWFNFIKYAMDNRLPNIDMGGNIDTSWREMIKRREEFKNPRYKWLYVPKKVKDYPDKQIDYKLIKGKLYTAKFIIRNDDVGFNTKLDEIRRFCEICDKYGFPIIQAITPFGEPKKITSRKMTNEQIVASSGNIFSQNKEVVEYLKKRNDLFAVHGLWHTHKPPLKEVENAKSILTNLGLTPTYFVPPFNEGEYPEEVLGLKTCRLSQEKKDGERLEDFLEAGTPSAPIVYLHSWRFNNSWYTFEMLKKCLQRLVNQK